MSNGGRLVIESQFTNSKSVSVSFADTGVGIPEENLDKLFEPLFITKTGGIGLGLAIVKVFVEAHNGSIEVRSEEGTGSTFTVRLP
jgi:signal transduction histidine kinase